MVQYTETYLADLHSIRDIVPAVAQLKGKSVLITGAGGLICSALVDALMELNRQEALGVTVYAAGRDRHKIETRFSRFVQEPGFRFLSYDATRPFETEQTFDYIIHGASNANPAAYVQQPVETMLANFNGLCGLLEVARKAGKGRVLYVSSSEVYGRKDTADAYREADYGFLDILNPRACYPSSKRAAETLCAAYYQEYGVDTVIVRPGHIYGPTMTAGDNRASSQFPRDVLAGRDIVMKSAGAQLRSYCYVLDCVSAMLCVLLNGTGGEAYNISNRHSVVTIREMAEAFAAAAGQTVRFESATEVEKAGYNLMDNSSLHSEKLEALGWQGRFDLTAGVQRTLEAMG